MVMHGYAHDDETIGKVYDSRLVKRFLPYMRPYGWRIVLAIVLLLGTTALILVQPFLVQQAIAHVHRVLRRQPCRAPGHSSYE